MRTFTAIVAALGARTAHAGLAQIHDGLMGLNELAAANGTENRAFEGFIAGFMNAINGYGCWCYFGEGIGSGKGPVQDSVDAECKVLAHGYKCVGIDALERGETCDPITKDYTPYNFFSATTDLEVDCATGLNAGDQCAIDMCIVEGRMTLAFFNQFFGPGITFDPTLSHPDGQVNQGPFDPEVECAVVPTGFGQTALSCCGQYQTNRFPFKTEDGTRDCCDSGNGDNLYIIATHDCCSDGSVATSGNC
jgi:hypothetical protein